MLSTGGYGRFGVEEELLTAWDDARRVAEAPDAQPGDQQRKEAAWQAMTDADAAAAEAVTASMHWVADHLALLWD